MSLVYITSKHVLLCIRDGFTLIEKSSHSLCSVPVYTFDSTNALSLMSPPTPVPLTLSSLYLWHQAIYLSECKHIRVPSRYVCEYCL